jgi:hypothetical protein
MRNNRGDPCGRGLRLRTSPERVAEREGVGEGQRYRRSRVMPVEERTLACDVFVKKGSEDPPVARLVGLRKSRAHASIQYREGSRDNRTGRSPSPETDPNKRNPSAGNHRDSGLHTSGTRIAEMLHELRKDRLANVHLGPRQPSGAIFPQTISNRKL